MIFLLINFLESLEFPVIVISLIDINYYYFLLMLFILLNEIQTVFFLRIIKFNRVMRLNL